MRERLALAAEDHLLVGDQAGQPHRVDRLVDVAAGLADQLRGPLRRPRGRVELAVVVQLDDLALGHVRGDPLRDLHQQHGADREVGSDEAVGAGAGRSAAARSGVEVEAGGADDGVDARPAGRRGRWRARCRGSVKSTTTSASPSTSASSTPSAGSALPASSMSSAPSTASQTAWPMRPAAPETDDPDHAATSVSLTGASASRKQLLVARRRRRRRAARRRRARSASSVRSSTLDRVDLGQHLVEAVDRQAEQGRAGDPRHPRRGRLRGEHEAALDVLLGPGQLLGGDRLGAQARRARRR